MVLYQYWETQMKQFTELMDIRSSTVLSPFKDRRALPQPDFFSLSPASPASTLKHESTLLRDGHTLIPALITPSALEGILNVGVSARTQDAAVCFAL